VLVGQDGQVVMAVPVLLVVLPGLTKEAIQICSLVLPLVVALQVVAPIGSEAPSMWTPHSQRLVVGRPLGGPRWTSTIATRPITTLFTSTHPRATIIWQGLNAIEEEGAAAS
jgi:hypothetical protein